MNRFALMTAALALATLTACAAPPPATTGGAAPAPANTAAAPAAGSDQLDKIKTAGVLKVSTDANYAPQSFFDEKTKVWTGFDIDVANEVAKRMGVKVEFTTPDWSAITAGSWAGRWDVSIGSMGITAERQKVLDFTAPYYYTPAQFAVRADLKDAIKSLDDLAGKTVCVGESTTYETYLNGKADFEVITPAPKDVKVGVVKTDAECLQSMQSGRKDYDAVLTAGNVIADGIKKGAPVMLLGKAVYAEKLGFSIDKNAAPNGKFLEQLNKAVADMHSDGTLTALSKKYYDGFDLTVVEK